jgi:acetyl esterase/lipase
MHSRRALLAATSAALALPACSPLQAFDTLTPKDGDVRRLRDHGRFADHARGKFDLFVPPQPVGAPIVTFIYGGSWDSGTKNDYDFAGRALAALGFVTAVPDYRLVPEVRFPSFLEDCAAAAKAALAAGEKLGANTNAHFLMGHSAGAYNAVMLALDTKYMAAVGAPAPAGVIGLAGPYDFLPLDVAASINAFGAWPKPAETQPVNFARADAPRALLLHGAIDETVRPRNTEALAKKLREAGGKVETKIYPDVDHAEILLALSRPFRGKASVLNDVKAFVMG